MFQNNAFQHPQAYQTVEATDAFQCYAFQPFAFQNSCEVVVPTDAFQCYAFQPFAFQNSCERVVDNGATGGWLHFTYRGGKKPRKRRELQPDEVPELSAQAKHVIEAVARRQIVTGPDVDAVQQLQELQAELNHAIKDTVTTVYLTYFKEYRRKLEEEKAIALIMINLLA